MRVSVQDAPPTPGRNRLNARDAIGMCRPFPDIGILNVEDDIRFDPDWYDWFRLCVASNRVVFGYMAHPGIYPKRVLQLVQQIEVFRHKKRQPPMGLHLETGLFGCQQPHNFWGSQCMYLPKWFLDLIWDHPGLHAPISDEEWGGMPIDGFYRGLFALLGAKQQPLVAVPNWCQHIGPPAVVNPKRRAHTSITHGMPSWPPPAVLIEEGRYS